MKSNNGVPLRVIQKISGHNSLEILQKYLEITDEQILEAVEAIGRKSKSVNPGKEKGRRVIY